MSKRILVVGNYPADQQQSMSRFAKLLVSFYDPISNVVFVCPPVLVARLPGLSLVARKYLAYIDKLFLFPLWLALRSRSFDLVHIADHSNSFYSFCCLPSRCIITCHDLLAVRAAMGDTSVACESSLIGIWLQRLIIAGLRHSGAIVFVSRATLDDYLRISGQPRRQRHSVIPNSLNAPFTSDLSSIQLTAEEQNLLPISPFLLMVGSSLPRKNRRLALRLLIELGDSSPYSIVLAGAPLSSDDQSFINKYSLAKQVHVIVRPSHSLLNSLYCRAHALLFPSLSEGFGWPLIEAQACGCPVIASTTTSIPEVAGEAALYADPQDVTTFASHVQALEDSTLRANIISQGEFNLRRYDPALIRQAYTGFAFHSSQLAV